MTVAGLLPVNMEENAQMAQRNIHALAENITLEQTAIMASISNIYIYIHCISLYLFTIHAKLAWVTSILNTAHYKA